jgi:hypothetical protein
VPGAGLEPAQSCDREILSLLCLPIPPPGHREEFFKVGDGPPTANMEARAGVEPAYVDLQSSA